jgi:hypothetical protein
VLSPGAVVVAALVVLSLLGAGCSVDSSAPTAAQVSDWMTTSGDGAAIGQVELDSRNIGLALSRHDPAAAIRTVCALLTTDAQTAIGNLPAPDNQLTDDLNQAYEDAASAGTDCYNGASGGRLLGRSASERAKLVPLLNTAIDRVVATTGHTPSTSTTQPSDAGGDPFGN